MPRKPTNSADPVELRRRAELHLKARQKAAASAPADVESDRQRQELEVHQIELQLQNAELLAARAELEAALEKYTDLYDFAPVGYLTLNPEGLIREANLTAASLLGLERSQLLKRGFGPFVSATELPAFNTFLENVFTSQVRQNCEVTLQLAGRGPLTVRMEAIAFESGLACRVTLTDVTERKRAETDRLILSKLESTGMLAGGICHDFNNLLTVILLNLELAQLLKPDEKVARHLTAAKAASLLAGSLTEQLATFANGGQAIRRATVISKLIQDAARPALDGSKVRCEFTLPEPLWVTVVDEGQIGQVLRNLVLNAREAMPDGGAILVRAENVKLGAGEQAALPAGEYVGVSITDHGAGIAKDVLPKIFAPYFSTKERGTQKGMGLGLTLCHTIVQKHGGALAVESDVGVGPTFHMYLPAIRPRKILLVADDQASRTIVSLMLAGMGHEVARAGQSRMAVEMYEQAKSSRVPFDVVLLELVVTGGTDGLETVLALRQIDPVVKAIVMSADPHEPVMLEPGRYGFSEALPKPFDRERLQEVLARVMIGTSRNQTQR